LASAIDAYQTNNRDVGFGGFLGSEFRNITFAGERAAAEKTLSAWQVYQRDDRHIRALNTDGNLSEAIRFDTSFAAGDSNGAFTSYDSALVKVTAINQKAFDADIGAGERELRGWAAIPAVAWAVIAALILVGCHPRLAEYK
jgi:hypothetical protein